MSADEKRRAAAAAGDDSQLGLFGALETTPALAQATSDRAWLQALLDFEAGLARAQAEAGLIPAPAALAIEGRCQAENFDLESLGRSAPQGGNPVSPMVRALMDQLPEDAATWVHWGATSQDAMDTAMMLVAKRSSKLLRADLVGAGRAAAELAERHRATLQVGRTLLQHAVPRTFGLKAAEWLIAILEVEGILKSVEESGLAVQLGGAAGTLASLEGGGTQVVSLLAAHLQLAEPLLPWHTDRVRPAQLASALCLVAGVAAKIAQDVVLLSQTEVGEVSEPESDGAGSSSAMPQKRNAASSVAIIASYRRIAGLAAVMLAGMAQELERATGDWQAEWTTLTAMLRLSGGVTSWLHHLLDGLQVDEERMAANLALTRGGIMAERVALELSRRQGRGPGRRRVDEASRRSTANATGLRDELANVPEASQDLGSAGLDELFEPATYLGATQELIDRALALRPGPPQEDA
ncbi:MAG: adenylosuccinate lyase family protein [Candidatus Dormiibacterota bacterium]